MNFRQVANRSPAAVTAIVAVLVGMAGWVVWSTATDAGTVKPAKAAFYTVDDGKSWFVDDITRLAPFDKDGKQAVQAFIFTCEGKEVCGYLERYTAKGKAVTEKYRDEQRISHGPPKSLGEMVSLGQGAQEVKRPGDSTWVNMAAGGVSISRFSCPGGGDAAPVRP